MVLYNDFQKFHLYVRTIRYQNCGFELKAGMTLFGDKHL